MPRDAAAFANEFMDVFQKAANAAKQEKEQIVTAIGKLNQQRESIELQIKEKEQQLSEVEDNIAKGLAHAARAAGVRLELGSTKKSDGRMTRERLDKVCQAVIGAMNKQFVTKAHIVEVTRLPKELINKAMTKLHREGRVNSNGKRGLLAKWKKK